MKDINTEPFYADYGSNTTTTEDKKETDIQEPIQPDTNESEGFKSAGWGIGSSKINLSIPENEEQMKQSW